MAGLFTRAIRPPELPNDNDPASVPPATVGPTSQINPGDPDGFTVEGPTTFSGSPPSIVASPWSGWPAEWNTPSWSGAINTLADTAWMCIDKNSKAAGTMPPYLVGAAPSLSADWLTSEPRRLLELGGVPCARCSGTPGVGSVRPRDLGYSTGWPSRFHVVPPWSVNAEMDQGLRRYRIGSVG